MQQRQSKVHRHSTSTRLSASTRASAHALTGHRGPHGARRRRQVRVPAVHQGPPLLQVHPLDPPAHRNPQCVPDKSAMSGSIALTDAHLQKRAGRALSVRTARNSGRRSRSIPAAIAPLETRSVSIASHHILGDDILTPHRHRGSCRPCTTERPRRRRQYSRSRRTPALQDRAKRRCVGG